MAVGQNHCLSVPLHPFGKQLFYVNPCVYMQSIVAESGQIWDQLQFKKLPFSSLSHFSALLSKAVLDLGGFSSSIPCNVY